jgi:hypothetical protein
MDENGYPNRQEASVQIEPKYSEPSIGIVEDPIFGCSGPVWIRGDKISV